MKHFCGAVCLIILIAYRVADAVPGCDGISSRISNGRPPTWNGFRFPSVVALQITSGNGPKLCGGSLIGPEYILTSAYCVNRSIEVEVILGANNISNIEEPGQLRVISRETITHEEWNPVTFANDIALVKLPYPIEYTDTIKPILVEPTDSDWTCRRSEVTGWGRRTYGGEYSDVMIFAASHFIPDKFCEEIYGSLYKKEMHFCTDPYYAFCHGDEGGPIIHNWYTVVGVASFGMSETCGSVKYPSVYTKAYNYRDWLSKYTPM